MNSWTAHTLNPLLIAASNLRLRTQNDAMNIECDPAKFDLHVGIFARKKHA